MPLEAPSPGVVDLLMLAEYIISDVVLGLAQLSAAEYRRG